MFVIVLPYLGVFVYLIARGQKMTQLAQRRAQAQDTAMRDYLQRVTGSRSSAEEIAHLAELRNSGVLTEEEFQRVKRHGAVLNSRLRRQFVSAAAVQVSGVERR